MKMYVSPSFTNNQNLSYKTILFALEKKEGFLVDISICFTFGQLIAIQIPNNQNFHEFILILLNCFFQKEAAKMFDCPVYLV